MLLVLLQFRSDYNVSLLEFYDALDQLVVLRKFDLPLDMSRLIVRVFCLRKSEELFGAKCLEHFAYFHQELEEEEGEFTLKLIRLLRHILLIKIVQFAVYQGL